MIEFSPLIVGTMRLGQWGAQMNTRQYEQFIDQCLELGLTDFDHADIYGDYTTEREFGEVLRKRKDIRDDIQLITKCGIRMVSDNRPNNRIKSYDSTAEYIEASVDRSLKNFSTDYIDVLLLHRPDFLMNPEEIAECFESLKKSGKVCYFGVSNFSPSQLSMLASYTDLITNQVEISITKLDSLRDGTLDQCLEKKIIPTAWAPLGGGVLFDIDPSIRTDRIVKCARKLCKNYDCSIDQLLIAWLSKHPSGIIPILGTTKILRLATALEALQIDISHEDWYELYQTSTGEIVP